MKTATLVAISFAFLAGCAQPQDETAPDEPTTDPVTQDYPTIELPPANDTEGQPEPVVLPTRFELAGCETWGVIADAPAQLRGEVSYPDGWDSSGIIVDQLGLEITVCQTFSWGPYERTNVGFAIDRYQSPPVPPACDSYQEWDLVRMLHQFWINDTEIAQALANTTGMPVQYADFEISIENGPLNTATVAWQVEGYQPSTLKFQAGGDDGGTRLIERYIWTNSTRLFFMDMDRTAAVKEYSLLAQGTISPPSLMAFYPEGAYAGGASWYEPDDIGGKFHAFEDHQCEKPIA
jgi:hypothetical protein